MLRLDLKNEFPLNADEVMLKDLYLRKIEIPNNILYDYFIKRYNIDLDGLDWASALISGNYVIAENAFIQKDLDICVFRQLRYSLGRNVEYAFYEITCVMHGSINIQMLSHDVDLVAGDICIIAPNTKHKVSINNDDSIVLNLLVRKSTFDKAFFETLTKNNILSNFFSNTLYNPSSTGSYLMFRVQDDDEIESLIFAAYKEYNTDRLYRSNMMNSILTMFFITLLRNHSHNAVVPKLEGGPPNRNITHILTYMQMNYKTVTIAELATVFNYSERHIARMLKESIGYSFTSILQSIKLNKAAELLLNLDLSIHDAAEICGFTNISHFYKIFCKRFDMTPQEYRKKKSRSC